MTSNQPTLPPTPDPLHRITLGTPKDCGEESDSIHVPGLGLGIIDSSIDYKLDDTHAPDYFLVAVTYGLFYRREGWSYKSYKLKLQADKNGDLHYEMLEGDDKNLSSADNHAQAGPCIRYTHAYRLYFYCMATYDNQQGQNYFTQSRQSLCLKTA